MPTNLAVQYEKNFGAGDDIVFTPYVSGGFQFPNDGNTVIWIANSNVAGVELTVVSARESDFGPYPDRTFQVGANRVRATPAWDPRRFSAPGTGLLTFTLDTEANVEVAAVARHTIFQEEA